MRPFFQIFRTAAIVALCVGFPLAQEGFDPEQLLDRARKEWAATHYGESAETFLRAAAGLKGEARTEALYRAGLAWTLLGEPEGLRKGAAVLADLLIEIEPEDRFYSKAMLVQSWNSASLGDSTLARKQLGEAEIYLPPDGIPRALWICREVLTTIGDRWGADSCSKKLKKLYPNSLEVMYGGEPAAAVTTQHAAPKADAQPQQQQPVARPGAAAKPAVTRGPAATKTGEWCLQLGAFGDRSNGEALVAQHASLPIPPQLIPLATGGKTLHLVRICPFRTREEAERYRDDHLGGENNGAQVRLIR